VAQELEELSSQLPSRALPTEVAKEVLDVRDRDRASALMARIYDAENGQVDAFLNCAGGCHHFGPLDTLSSDDIDEIVDVNFKAPVYWMRELLPRMRTNRIASADQKRGQLVMLSSRSGERALPNLNVYAAAKGGIERLVDAVRTEYAGHRIGFTLINPGSIDTGFAEHWPSDHRDAHKADGMSVDEAAGPILQALTSQFVLNKISYESAQQWIGEPGVMAVRIKSA
jgi:NADP-dependent 3-hydroxy acid dehydrogenase YdfG